MRSYENNRHHQSFTINETDDILETEFYTALPPSKFFLQQLDDPNHVLRSKTFKKTGILKLQANSGVNLRDESENESQYENGLPIIFDGDLSNIDL